MRTAPPAGGFPGAPKDSLHEPKNRSMDSMNDAQREAVAHGAGPLLVLAGPGSGKTFTITRRIFYLLEEMHIPPEQILVITFTKAAALSMQSRFREQSEQIYPVNFGTFHSCFYHILRQSHVLDAYKIATEAQKRAIVSRLKDLWQNQAQGQGLPSARQSFAPNEALSVRQGFAPNGAQSPKQSFMLNVPQYAMQGSFTPNAPQSFGRNSEQNQSPGAAESNSAETAARFLQAFSYYKNTGDEAGAVKKLPMEHQASFPAVFGAYEEERERRKLLDFDDMLYQCRRLLESDASLRAYWQGRFSHILMDEFQDINPMQYEVVKLLSGGGAQLFAVGDDDQSIYGFRGSQPACLKQFQREFCAKAVYLSLNYRSVPQIVQASLQVISENKDRFVKNLTSAASEGGGAERERVSLKAFAEKEEQYRYLAEKLCGLLGKNPSASPPQSLGVLFRTNSYMQGFAARLSRMGIPYEMKEKVTSIYEHFIVKDMMAYLTLAEGSGGREELLRILNKPLRYLSRESLGGIARDKTAAKAQPYCGMSHSGCQPAGSKNPSEVFRMLEFMRAYYRNAPDVAYRRERLLSADKLAKDFSAMKSRSLYLKLQYILKGMGYEKHLKELSGNDAEKWQEYHEILEWLCGEAKAYEDVGQWLKAKETYEKTLNQASAESADGKGRRHPDRYPQASPGAADDRNRSNQNAANEAKIHLMTVHASKGLEFDRVWIPDCNEKVFPHGTMPDSSACEEERRIFYVAMTRAKKSLELLYLTGTKERPRLPSRFLNPLIMKNAVL